MGTVKGRYTFYRKPDHRLTSKCRGLHNLRKLLNLLPAEVNAKIVISNTCCIVEFKGDTNAP
jgi:hypothetical protein